MAEEMTFEKILEMMAKMSPEEREAKTEEGKKICKDFCGECQSYTGTRETELLFCATGKSCIITEEKGCLCLFLPSPEKHGPEMGLLLYERLW